MSDPQIIILIGAARSGTKFLRDTLATHPQVGCVPFDVNFTWREGNEDLPDDVLPAERCTEKIAGRIRESILAGGRRNRPGCRIVVEKTVSNALRVPFVHRAIPDAKYIFLSRDGKSVVESAHRVWNLPTPLSYKLRKLAYLRPRQIGYLGWYALNNLKASKSGAAAKHRVWGPRYEGMDEDQAKRPLDEICARQWCASVNAAEDGRALVPETQQFQISYEEWVSGERLQEIAEFVGVDDSQPWRDAFQKNLRPDDQNKKADTFYTPERRERLGAIMNPTLKRFGYAPIETATPPA